MDSSAPEHCRVCDRPLSRIETAERVVEESGIVFCFGGQDCETHRVDWRARALAAEAETARWKLQSDDWQRRGWEVGFENERLCEEIDRLRSRSEGRPMGPRPESLLEAIRRLFWSIGTHAAPITSNDWREGCYVMLDPDSLRDLLFEIYETLAPEDIPEALRPRRLIPSPQSKRSSPDG